MQRNAELEAELKNNLETLLSRLDSGDALQSEHQAALLRTAEASLHADERRDLQQAISLYRQRVELLQHQESELRDELESQKRQFDSELERHQQQHLQTIEQHRQLIDQLVHDKESALTIANQVPSLQQQFEQTKRNELEKTRMWREERLRSETLSRAIEESELRQVSLSLAFHFLLTPMPSTESTFTRSHLGSERYRSFA